MNNQHPHRRLGRARSGGPNGSPLLARAGGPCATCCHRHGLVVRSEPAQRMQMTYCRTLERHNLPTGAHRWLATIRLPESSTGTPPPLMPRNLSHEVCEVSDHLPIDCTLVPRPTLISNLLTMLPGGDSRCVRMRSITYMEAHFARAKRSMWSL